MARFSIIIVNFNAGNRLRTCLEALSTQTFAEFDAIIIDNGSSDGSTQCVRDFSFARLIELGRNEGFARANNLAVEETNAPWIAFLNPDAYPRPTWLEEVAKGQDRYPFADAFGSTQLSHGRPDILDGAGDALHILGLPYRGGSGHPASARPEDHATLSACAAAAIYRRERFVELGGFDERFFCYGEDVDLGARLMLDGGQTVQLKDAVVEHEGSALTGATSDFTLFHSNRNRIWVLFKILPGRYFWPLLPLRLLTDAYFAARTAMAGHGTAYAKGVWAGYRGIFDFIRDRRELQSKRRAKAADVGTFLAWSPRALRERPVKSAELEPRP